MAKNTHLTLSDRIAIEVSLRERKSFSAIAEELGKDPTTISKEIRTHIKLKQAEDTIRALSARIASTTAICATPASSPTESLVTLAIRPSALRHALTFSSCNAPN